ncbi:fructosamine kinase family protein [Ilyomonas limi]|uniref:fructosamine kinase family protein n=1 Tax=Ilyomonas limi TaxID=2575867 RepID=UPI001484E64C|nr:fructosamine kinase family protein [Ilyomonas limi]
MKAALLQHFQSELSCILNKTVLITASHQVFGGDINATYLLTTNTENFFVKLNTIAAAGMLLKERDGLQLLRIANTSLTIPQPIVYGTYGQQSFLLMEYLEKGIESKGLWQHLATGLAQLHQHTQPYFGLNDNNYIGTVPQNNTAATTWVSFYAQQRIMPLMQQAYDQHKCTKDDIQLAERLYNKLSALMPEEPPALLHGDLWSGNYMFTVKGEAAVYDPAVYYGHREMDIAMTLLFGGFDARFYSAYNEAFPLEEGWRSRVDICQLYPLLVHLLLFGGHYYGNAKNILKKYA